MTKDLLCLRFSAFLLSFRNQGKNIIVFYGSQTGTGEEFANRLSKDAQRYGMKGMAADPEEYDMVIYTWRNIQIRGHSHCSGRIHYMCH